jgi:hypothetical protein
MLTLGTVLYAESRLCLAGFFSPHLTRNAATQTLGVEVLAVAFSSLAPPAYLWQVTPSDDEPIAGKHPVGDSVKVVLAGWAPILLVALSARTARCYACVELYAFDGHPIPRLQYETVEHALGETARLHGVSMPKTKDGVPHDVAQLRRIGSGFRVWQVVVVRATRQSAIAIPAPEEHGKNLRLPLNLLLVHARKTPDSLEPMLPAVLDGSGRETDDLLQQRVHGQIPERGRGASVCRETLDREDLCWTRRLFLASCPYPFLNVNKKGRRF